uniref:Uncharacterized protein n=1 Tax=Rhizophora mucronata TaxID=61149 RepID=A0A2P2JXQ4_RHIMU
MKENYCTFKGSVLDSYCPFLTLVNLK